MKKLFFLLTVISNFAFAGGSGSGGVLGAASFANNNFSLHGYTKEFISVNSVINGQIEIQYLNSQMIQNNEPSYTINLDMYEITLDRDLHQAVYTSYQRNGKWQPIKK